MNYPPRHQAMEIAMEINELEINPTEEKIDHSHNIVDPEEEEADSDKEYISGPVPATPPRRTTGPSRQCASPASHHRHPL